MVTFLKIIAVLLLVYVVVKVADWLGYDLFDSDLDDSDDGWFGFGDDSDDD